MNREELDVVVSFYTFIIVHNMLFTSLLRCCIFEQKFRFC